MRVVVWVPWRTDRAHRQRLYDAVRPEIAALGWPIVEADSGHDPFSVANTWNAAAAASEDWDVALLHAADLHVPAGQIRAALTLVDDGAGMTYCHDRHLKLTQTGTAAFIAGKRTGWEPAEFAVAKSMTAGPRFVTRHLWEQAGGFDPRFVGWGYEDDAFKAAAERVAAHQRVSGDMVNLWHPKAAERPGDPYWQARDRNRRLWHSIRDASPKENTR